MPATANRLPSGQRHTLYYKDTHSTGFSILIIMLKAQAMPHNDTTGIQIYIIIVSFCPNIQH